jgi:DHA1 family bicyclomycin/chloramphenicol resistance-like MFS transporter
VRAKRSGSRSAFAGGQDLMRRLRILFMLALASALSTMSMDYFAPSMPSVTRDFGVSVEAVKSTMTMFLLGYAFGPFVWGSLADRIGRRRVMLAGLAGYLLASLACMFSQHIAAFSGFRVAQGFCAASAAIVARAVLRDVYGPTGATKAIASMFLIMVWVPIVAPFVGGMASALFDWRINFLVMVCVAGAALLAAYAWLEETNPAHLRTALPAAGRWKEILIHPVFLRHTLTNMFLFAGLLLFLANYAYVTETLYGFTSQQNGFVLTTFNAAVAAGFYLVWLTVPRIGVERSIRAGVWMASVGWVSILALSLAPEPNLAMILPMVAVACMGMGLVISLAAGEALVPFAHAAGTASALFILIQSMGASLLNLLVSVSFDVTMTHLAASLAACALLSFSTSRLPARPVVRAG